MNNNINQKTDEVFKKYKYYFKSLYKSYKYINQDIFNDILSTVINNNINYYDGTESFFQHLIIEINKSLDDYISGVLKDFSRALKIINEYINKMFNKSLIVNNYFDCLNKLNDFLVSHNFNNDTKVITLLLDNPKFNKMIELVIRFRANNKDCIINNFGILSIKVYSEKNKIDFDDIIDDNLELNTSFNIIKEIQKYPLLSENENRELLKRISLKDENAKDYFIKCNLRLVLFVAKQYKNFGIPYNELINEGTVGLIEAVDRYNLSYNNKFSTYAFYWIRLRIKNACINYYRNIKITPRIYDSLVKYKSLVENNELNDEAIISTLGITKNQFNILKSIQNNTISEREKDGDINDIFDTIYDSNINLEKDYIKKDLKPLIKELLDNCNLSDMEKEIIKLCFGFYNNHEYTVVEIANIYHISRQNTHQKINRALKKMRVSPLIYDLLNYSSNPKRTHELILYYRECYKNPDNQYINNLEKLNIKVKELTKDDYYNVLELLESDTFKKLLDIFTEKEALVLLLSLGFVNKRSINSISIAYLLDISEREVLKIMKNIYINYSKLNKYLIITSSQGNTLKLKLNTKNN